MMLEWALAEAKTAPIQAGFMGKDEKEEQELLQSGAQALRPKARLLRAIGNELISNPTVAVLELIKNSYDADATAVLVRFIGPLQAGRGRVEVIDDGNGMTLDTIRGAWLEPATDFKRREPRSERFRRRVLGEKGLGRFAAAAISRFLYVNTRRIGATTETQVLLDWSDFDHADRYLDEVEVLWEETRPSVIVADAYRHEAWPRFELVPPPDAHGTILSLEALNTSWSASEFKALQNAISRLVSPHRNPEDERFAVYLDIPEPFAKYSGLVEPPAVLKHPHYRLEGRIEGDGSFKLRYGVPGAFVKKEGKFTLSGERAPCCGPLDVAVSAWDRDTVSLRPLAERLERGLTALRKDINAFAGINVYRDGFRVLPYGETGNDWLNLDRRRVDNPTLRLSNKQVNGYIDLTLDDNPLLRDQSNREGLIENQAYLDLRELMRAAMALLEEERFRIRRPGAAQAERASSGEGLFTGFNVEGIKRAILERHPDDKVLLQLVEAEEERLGGKVEAFKTVLARYQGLAVLGTLIDMVLHESRTPLASLIMEVKSLQRRLRLDSSAQIQLAQPEAERVQVGLDRLMNKAQLIDIVLRRIEPFGGRKRGRPTDQVVEKQVENAVAILHSEIKSCGARVHLPATRTVVRVDPAELQQIVLNLVRNSLHWLREVPKEAREIDIVVERVEGGAVAITVSDSGPGVPPENWSSIFLPYFSTKPDGVGLGLAIVGGIVHDYYDGKLELLEEGPLDGATFRVTLARRV